ncbi:MAG: phenylalanine--tRNA ligase subunit beta [Candidatus Gracilibacteria bacterium]|nr:phenylalanine--tRNA ligase subunit beta [Candidatus Gracilibacteria bacterium]
MKISYKVLQKYIKNIKSAEDVAKDLVMHTAEVEDIHSEKNAYKNIVLGRIKKIEKHPDADSLKICNVDAGENEDIQIVCGGSNLEVGQAVAVAKIGASVLWHGQGEPVIMKKTAIRGVESSGMICASEEIGLKKEFPAGSEKEILDLSFTNAKNGTPLDEVVGKDDAVLEIDNKAINHRPDLFSHIGIIREIYAINGEKFDFNYEIKDFSGAKDLGIKNSITNVVSRYMGLKVENVANIESPDYIKQVLASSDIASKGLLIDLSNYSLYFYGQPTHCFDADKVIGNITIRYAKKGEKFIALNDSEYELSSDDIVIADDEKVLALGGVIGGKSSAVSDATKNIVIESANFDQATIRKTGKRLGVRTDALNVFEKDIVNGMQEAGLSLIVSELEKNLKGIKIISFSDIYPNKQKEVRIDFDLKFYNKILGTSYSEESAIKILDNLGIKKVDNKLLVPFWRKDLNFKADIAEELARISGYDNITSTIPEIYMGAVIQNNIYKVKNDVKNYFSSIGYYDMFTYSFVNEQLMEKCLSNTANLIPMKNALSEELTHLRGSLIPNLMLSLEKNINEYDSMKLFEIEKVFNLNNGNIIENYNLAGVEISNKEIAYYDIQNTVSNFLKSIGVFNFSFENSDISPNFSHKGRTGVIMVRGASVGYIGEIHPKVTKNFDINSRVGFFEINIEKLEPALYQTIKAKDISSFQENNFDLNFVIDKSISGNKIKIAIEKTNKEIINKVELVDIYENEDKLPGKRSFTYKIFIQSIHKTLDDKDKAELINEIIKNVAKIGGELR